MPDQPRIDDSVVFGIVLAIAQAAGAAGGFEVVGPHQPDPETAGGVVRWVRGPYVSVTRHPRMRRGNTEGEECAEAELTVRFGAYATASALAADDGSLSSVMAQLAAALEHADQTTKGHRVQLDEPETQPDLVTGDSRSIGSGEVYVTGWATRTTGAAIEQHPSP